MDSCFYPITNLFSPTSTHIMGKYSVIPLFVKQNQLLISCLKYGESRFEPNSEPHNTSLQTLSLASPKEGKTSGYPDLHGSPN